MKENKEFLEKDFLVETYPKLYRFFSVLPGGIALLILFIVSLGYWIFITTESSSYHQLVFFVALFILAYYIWWIIRGFEYLLLSFAAAFKFRCMKNLDFKKILGTKSGKLSKKEHMFKKELKNDINPEEIIHRFIVPTYKETEDILTQTIEAINQCDYSKDKIAVTIAGEEGDKENFLKIAQNLTKKYKNCFGYINHTLHPKGMPGELPGKGSNIKYAAKKEYEKILEFFSTTSDKVIVTTLDADTNVGDDYLQILTYNYICTEDRKHKSYQPMIFFFNNFWDAPFFSKLIGLCNSFWILFNSVKKLGMRNFSTHAQPLDALIELDFRSSQTIVEDGHQYRRSFFGFKGNHECLPLYTKVYQDANLNETILKTAKAQYNQMRRWSHGVEDIPYVFCQWVYNFRSINFNRTLYEFIRLFEGIVLWSTLHIILTVGLVFTMVRDIKLSSFVTLGKSISVFTNFSLLILITVIVFQFLFLPRNRITNYWEKTKEGTVFVFLYSWMVGPILLLFSGIPALHTQIGVMLGKPMKKFNVTQKYRKK